MSTRARNLNINAFASSENFEQFKKDVYMACANGRNEIVSSGTAFRTTKTGIWPFRKTKTIPIYWALMEGRY